MKGRKVVREAPSERAGAQNRRAHRVKGVQQGKCDSGGTSGYSTQPAGRTFTPEEGQRGRKAAKTRSRLLSSKKGIEKLTADLLEGQREAVRAKALEMPKGFRHTYLKAVLTHSLRAAIDAWCAECMGWEDVERQVRECASLDCPFHKYRRWR